LLPTNLPGIFPFCRVSSKKKINILNLGTEEYISVKQSVKIICNKLGVKPKVFYQKNKTILDTEFIHL